MKQITRIFESVLSFNLRQYARLTLKGLGLWRIVCKLSESGFSGQEDSSMVYFVRLNLWNENFMSKHLQGISRYDRILYIPRTTSVWS